MALFGKQHKIHNFNMEEKIECSNYQLQDQCKSHFCTNKTTWWNL